MASGAKKRERVGAGVMKDSEEGGLSRPGAREMMRNAVGLSDAAACSGNRGSQ